MKFKIIEMATIYLVKQYDPQIMLDRDFCVRRDLYEDQPLTINGKNLGLIYEKGQDHEYRSLSIGDLIEISSGLYIIMPIGFKPVKWGMTLDLMATSPLDNVPDAVQIDFFKKPQRSGFHYYKVYGGPGKTENGYQEVINFLNDKPIISIENNDIKDCTGTWCTYEVGIPITKEEYQEAYKKATANDFQTY